MKNINYIFDFDGTLVDSFDTVVNKFNLLAKEFNFRSIKDDEIDDLKNLTSKQLIKHLNISLYKIPKVIKKARMLMQNEMKLLPPVKNMKEVLCQIYDMHVHIGILTSNSAENVSEWLNANDMQHFFDFIHVDQNYFGKKRVLRKMIKSYKMDKSHTFYIGDETRDVEAAKGCGVQSVAVLWGFNSEQILSQCQPHFIARKPEDLLTLLN
jgi:phosphoglycolate phosphatase